MPRALSGFERHGRGCREPKSLDGDSDPRIEFPIPDRGPQRGGSVATETIEAGSWLYTEGGLPQYFIYRLLQGKVSIYKGPIKIREFEQKEGDSPVTFGIPALLRENRQHMSSVKAESDLVIERVYTDRIRQILKAEIPKEMKEDLKVITQSIVVGWEAVSRLNHFRQLRRVDLEIPVNLGPETLEVLREIKRLYDLVRSDVKKL